MKAWELEESNSRVSWERRGTEPFTLEAHHVLQDSTRHEIKGVQM